MQANPENYPYQAQGLLLGIVKREGYKKDKILPIGVTTERHAITIAGAGSGKGVAVIIPNLLKWKANALVIDPKGEAVNATAKARQEKGQSVHVLDPFNCCPSWTQKASLNPLDSIDTNSLTAREDIGVLADGIVMRGKDGTAEHWDKGASDLIAGVIAVVCLTQPPERRNLVSVRQIIADKELLENTMEQAKIMTACGNLPQNGASAYFAQEGGYFVSNAEKNTNWLDSPAIQSVFKSSSFALSDLKNEDATVYLVLPANYLVEHGRFLRLFVRSSIEAMQKPSYDGKLRKKQCLFLLDEFFALGYINEIAVSAGLMRGYGLQLWPILQDLGQLISLYGQEGAQTFFGNADVHQFFGNMDAPTLNYISQSMGTITASDALGGISFKEVKITGKGPYWKQESEVKTAVHDARYNENLQRKAEMNIGKPRATNDQIAQLVGNENDGFPISRHCVCFVPGGRFLLLNLLPYWAMAEVTDLTEALPSSAKAKKAEKPTHDEYGRPIIKKEKNLTELFMVVIPCSLIVLILFVLLVNYVRS